MTFNSIPDSDIEVGDTITRAIILTVKQNLDDLNSRIINQTTTTTLTGSVIDWNAGNFFADTIVAGKTYSFQNNVSGRTIVLKLKNDSAAALNLAWPAGIRGASTLIPPNSFKIFTFLQIGTDIFSSSLEF
jgi:hypothetical protein